MKAVGVVTARTSRTSTQRELVEAAIRGIYKRLDEKVPSAVKDKLDNIKNMKEADLLTAPHRGPHAARQARGPGQRQGLHLLADSMLGKLDRHTTTSIRKPWRNSRRRLTGNSPASACKIRKDNARDMLLVVTPIKGSPAYKAKIQAGDIITTSSAKWTENGKPT